MIDHMDHMDHMDHIVLTTVNLETYQRFYVDVMGMQLEKFCEGRLGFRFGVQKINVHVKSSEFEPDAHLPVSGSLDLCFIGSCPLDEVIKHLEARQWPIIEGPVQRRCRPWRHVQMLDPCSFRLSLTGRGAEGSVVT